MKTLTGCTTALTLFCVAGSVQAAGTYYLSEGWLESGFHPLAQLEEWSARHGEEKARQLGIGSLITVGITSAAATGFDRQFVEKLAWASQKAYDVGPDERLYGFAFE